MPTDPAGCGFWDTEPGLQAGRGRWRVGVARLGPQAPRRSVLELEEAFGGAAVGGVAGLQRPCGRALAVRVGGWRVRALAGAAARLRARARLLHPPPLRQGGLIHVLEAEPLSLVLVEGLGENSKVNTHWRDWCWSFGHLMRRADSLAKTLMLGKIEGGRRRGRQRMRWLEGITNSKDMLLLLLLLLLLSRVSCVRLCATP